MKFKVGDIIRGKKDNGYRVTNGEMYKAKVIRADKLNMGLKILEHADKGEIGNTYGVDNSEEKFELIYCKKPTTSDIPVGSKITTDTGIILIKKINENYEGENTLVLFRDEVTESLTILDRSFGSKIVKVEMPDYYTLWEEPKQEVKEMTLAEVCKELGYNVKIVKEEE